MKNITVATSNLAVAKIVATPTPTSWSQTYNAGGLFAVLSLTKEPLDQEQDETLSHLGKNLFNNLEAEYFALETKNLDSIRGGIATCSKMLPNNVSACLTVAAVINNILYAFVLGRGKVIIKRGVRLSAILDQSRESTPEIRSTSGFLENGDVIILETEQFTKIISNEKLKNSLDHYSPNEIAEALSPKVHEAEEGGASAIIVSYKEGGGKSEIEENLEEQSAPQESIIAPQKLTKYFSFLRIATSNIQRRLNYIRLSLTHTKKVFLTIAFILGLIFITSVFFANKKQEEAKTQALFQEIFSQAQKKHEEGQSLLGLNKNLAREDLETAQKILSSGQSKFHTGSKEQKQILSLLKKVEEALFTASEVNFVQPKEVDKDKSKLLSAELSNQGINYFYQDGKVIYSVNADALLADGKEKIKNKDFWKEPGGLGVYLGNIYVLDKKDGIIKFVGGEAVNKTSYFASGVNPDLSKAASITIDGSIYILLSDGAILKFTKGKAEAFNVSSLDKPFSSPTRIYTSVNNDKIYVLDNGNTRIVVLDKNGAYSSQYQAAILKNAKDFEVLESSKKIFVLSQNKIWEIDIK